MPAQPASPQPGSGAPAPGADWVRYGDNVVRHLGGISRDLQSRVMRSLARERGYRGLRPSLGPFLSLVWTEPRPLGEIATQLAISRQACSQLASLAEDAGYLERRPDPGDRRSRRVRLTARGRRLVEDGLRIIVSTDADYAGIVGDDAYARFTDSLAGLHAGLGIPAHPDAGLTRAASRSVGLLPLLVVRLQRMLVEGTVARGHAGLKMSHARVLPLIRPEGSRIRQLAGVQRVTRQAISAMARDLERLGYLDREPDPEDRRGIVLRPTPQGEHLIVDVLAALDDLEASLLEILGPESLDELRATASELQRALHPDAPRSVAPPSAPRDAEGELRALARRLRRQLGRRGAARLGALLQESPW